MIHFFCSPAISSFPTFRRNTLDADGAVIKLLEQQAS